MLNGLFCDPRLLPHSISSSAAFFNLSLWLIEIEINMLDEKLIKFLALQRIHQLFPSRVQTSPGSVGAHPLASGGHHTEGARARLPPHHTVTWPSPLHGESQLSISQSSVPFIGLIKHYGSFLRKQEQDGIHSFQLRLREVCHNLNTHPLGDPESSYTYLEYM